MSAVNKGSEGESGQHQDQLTIDQVQAIRDEIAATQPMIGPNAPVKVLVSDYQDAEQKGFVAGIEFLDHNYSAMRKVRGDGNCFYRAFLFGYLENLLNAFNAENDEELKLAATQEKERIISVAEASMAELTAVGYSEFTIETFYDEFVDLVKDIFTLDNEALLTLFQEGGKSDYFTWFMRLLAAGYIKRDAERFLPFVEGLYFDIDSFCKAEVEPMNKECEQIQIIALSEYLGITVEIAYLDGKDFDPSVGISTVVFPDPSSSRTGATHNKLRVNLLYRPGHYDILYK